MSVSIKIDCLNFSPELDAASLNCEDALLIIQRAIIEGSGGPDSVAITEAGLRFIRHILSTYSGLPNFKNQQTIKYLAQDFIYQCGSPALALQKLQNIML